MFPIRSLALALLLLGLLATPTPAQDKFSSVYTPLSSAKCHTLQVDKETGSSVQSCPGTAGYKLHALDDDSRQSLEVVDPAGKKHELEFWHVITLGFSSLGDKAEWRVTRKNGKIVPVALIVRVNASEDPENSSRLTSYLTVTKITPEKICATHKIRATSGANDEARRAADVSATAPCLKDINP